MFYVTSRCLRHDTLIFFAALPLLCRRCFSSRFVFRHAMISRLVYATPLMLFHAWRYIDMPFAFSDDVAFDVTPYAYAALCHDTPCRQAAFDSFATLLLMFRR